MRLIRFKFKKGHSQISLKMSYTYHNLCCIPVAYLLHLMLIPAHLTTFHNFFNQSFSLKNLIKWAFLDIFVSEGLSLSELSDVIRERKKNLKNPSDFLGHSCVPMNKYV